MLTASDRTQEPIGSNDHELSPRDPQLMAAVGGADRGARANGVVGPAQGLNRGQMEPSDA